jgi:hypothetical protein
VRVARRQGDDHRERRGRQRDRCGTFKTAGATLTSSDDSAPVTLGDDSSGHLRHGMVVTVRGRLDDATHREAAEVEFHDELEGEVETHGPGEVVVSGVHVSLDGDSTLEDQQVGGASADDLTVGTRRGGHRQDRHRRVDRGRAG